MRVIETIGQAQSQHIHGYEESSLNSRMLVDETRRTDNSLRQGLDEIDGFWYRVTGIPISE